MNIESRVFFARDLNTPLMRYYQRPFTPETLETNSPLRILMVMAEPSNMPPLNMDKEETQLRRIVSEVQGQIHFEVLQNATLYELQRKVASMQPHILHFVGHGEFKDGEGVLLLEDDNGLARRLNAEQMADLLRNRGVKLVVLNACETAASAEGDAFMGVAPSLVLAGIPAVIAMQFAAPDTIAINFNRALYDHLALGMPLDRAVTEMRISASTGFTPEDQVFWGLPALFTRSQDGVIWQIDNRADSPDNINTEEEAAYGDLPLAELAEQIANDIKRHIPSMDELDAKDLQEYVEDAQRRISRNQYERASKKLEDAADLIEELEDMALMQKVQQALALCRDIQGTETHSFLFFGSGEFQNNFILTEGEIEDLKRQALGAFRKAAWGDENEYNGQVYRYVDRNLDRLKIDLFRLAIRGYQFYDTIISRVAGNADKASDLADLMLMPGQIQLARIHPTLINIPASSIYDYPLNTGLKGSQFKLCSEFEKNLKTGAKLEGTACFNGNCPSFGNDDTICPSGFGDIDMQLECL